MLTTAQVANRLDITTATVRARAKRLGIAPALNGRSHLWPGERLLDLATVCSSAWRELRDEAVQIEVAPFKALSLDDLFPTALACMHALNRLAKHKQCRVRDIYAVKDAFCDAVLGAGKATLYTYIWPQVFGHTCGCGRSWEGRNDICFGCGGRGTADMYDARWWVVDCGGGYRFHRRRVPEGFEGRAVECGPHNPTQPQREVPDVGLSEEAQMAVVKLATERLKQAVAAPPKVTPCRSRRARRAPAEHERATS